MPLPPGARPLNVAEVRRQFAAGTLGTVGDDAGREHVERDGVAPNPNGAYGDAMSGSRHDLEPNDWHRPDDASAMREHVRQSRLQRWQEPRV